MARKKTESPPTEPDFPEGTKGPAGQPPSKLMETDGGNPTPDPARQTAHALLKRMENDFKYHAPKEGQPAKYEAIRAAGHTFAKLLADLCPEGRELSTAITHIENAVFWGNAAIARS